MSLANVNIGTIANDGTGDPLRSAFRTINQNFANLAPFAANGNITYNAGVASVAGRTGNVTLTITDITGAASTGYVDAVAANIANIAANIAGNLNTVIWANVTGKPSFATIATTASWDDLVDIPANVLDAITQTEVDNANSAMVANITAANARIGQLQSNINTLFSNAAVQHIEFSNLRANITAANAAIAAVSFDSVNANVTAANAAIAALVTANVNQGSYIELNTSRVAAANVEIANLRANITAANTAIGAVTTAWTANAGTQQTQINTINANVSAANSAVTALSIAVAANNVAQGSLISSLQNAINLADSDISTLFGITSTIDGQLDTIKANIGAFHIYANANASSQQTQINVINANVSAANSAITALVLANTTQNSILQTIDANIGNLWVWVDEVDDEAYNLSMIFANLVTANMAVESNIANLQANTAQLGSNIAILYANAVTQLGLIDLVNSNVTAQASRVDDVYSNIAVRMADITTLFSNAATQSVSLTTLTANAATQSVAITSLDANVGRISSNVGTFQSNLAALYDINASHGNEIDLLYGRASNLEFLTANITSNVNAANAAIIAAEGNLMLITNDIYANLASKVNDVTAANVEIAATNSAIGIVNNTIDTINANIGVLYNLLPVGNANVAAANVAIAAVVSNVASIQTALQNSVVVTASNTRVGVGAGVGTRSVSVGWTAGATSQGTDSVAVGTGAGNDNQGNYAVAVGRSAGNVDQGNYAVAIGNEAGVESQGVGAIAIGHSTGFQQGNNSIIIGRGAGPFAAANSIVLDATNISLTSFESGLYIKPIRNLNAGTTANVVSYNSVNGELSYGNLAYTPNNAAHWNGTVSNVAAALDQLAARIWAIENP